MISKAEGQSVVKQAWPVVAATYAVEEDVSFAGV
jgi:hypothetical protein